MSLALGITLLLSGGTKIIDLQTSAQVSVSVGILPKSIAFLFGLLLPFVELLFGILLIVGYEQKWTGLLTSLLMLSFAIANVKIIRDEKDVACNCFGRLMIGKMGRGGLYHSLVLLSFCIPVILWPETNRIDLLGTAGGLEFSLIVLPAIGLFFTGIISRMADLS